MPAAHACTLEPPSLAPDPARLHPGVWRGNQLAAPIATTVPTGYARLDAELPGKGWPAGMLTELLMPQWGVGEVQLLAPALAELTADAHREAIFIAPPYPPCAQAFHQLGVALKRLTVLRATRPVDSLWSAEQALKSGVCGVLALWCSEATPDQLRRLQLAAQGTNALVFVLRHSQCLAQSSPSPLRLALAAAPGRTLRIEIPKRRGPALEAPLVIELPRPLPLKLTVTADRLRMVGSLKAVLHALDRSSSSEASARSADALA